METHLTNYKWIILDKTESTNNYAMGLVHEGMAEDKTVIFTHNQTAGKGQRSKSWSTEPGSAITLSLIIGTPLPSVIDKFLLSAAMAVGAYDYFARYAHDDATIKWPNDIYWRDRKAGGILIENSLSGNDWKWAIAGIGININQTLFPAALPNPVSLKQITGKTFDVIKEAGILLWHLDTQLNRLINKEYRQIMNSYNEHLYKKKSSARFRMENIVFESRVETVTKDGRIHLANGNSYDFGELEWVI